MNSSRKSIAGGSSIWLVLKNEADGQAGKESGISMTTMSVSPEVMMKMIPPILRLAFTSSKLSRPIPVISDREI